MYLTFCLLCCTKLNAINIFLMRRFFPKLKKKNNVTLNLIREFLNPYAKY